jgi:biotin carboxylase
VTGPLVVLGGGPGQLGALRAAARLGVDVVVCDRDPRPLALRLGACEHVEPVSTMDEAGIEELARRVGARGVLAPGTDLPVRLAARVAARLGLPHPITPEVAVLATDKRSQRVRLAGAGLPQPAFSLDGTRPADGAVVVKPSDAQGQRGLAVVAAGEALEPALARARALAPGGEALVEELVPGPEITVNGFSAGGRFTALTVTDRERAAAFGVATAHLFPAEREDGAAAVAGAACAALGIEDGPSYTQLVLGPGGPRVVEVAARLGGGHDAELCEAVLGVDLAGLAVRAALGERPGPGSLEPTRRRGGLVRFLLAPPGRVVQVEGVDEARAVAGVIDALSYRSPGDVVAPIAVGADRAGFVLATGSTRAEAEAAAAAAARRVRFAVGRSATLPA